MGYLEKIKYILRGSRYYRKYFQTTVNSLRYYFRNLHYYWQLYAEFNLQMQQNSD